MIEFELSALVAPVISAITVGIGIYVAMSNRLSILETKVDTLNENVHKHNSIVERTYKLESDMATAWRRYDDLSDRIGRVEGKGEHHAD